MPFRRGQSPDRHLPAALLAAGVWLAAGASPAWAGRLIIGEEAPPVVAVSFPAPPADPGPVVKGFAAPLPLDIVVRQVVPRAFPIHFAPGVDSRQKAGWRGGRGWRLVLADMLAPLSLSFEERSGGVWVVRAPVQPAAGPPIPLRPGLAPAAAPAVAPKLIGWQLRGAVPGRAWVIPPNGKAGTLADIAEGQTVETLGRVDHIFQKEGRWVVEAQNGWFEGDAP